MSNFPRLRSKRLGTKWWIVGDEVDGPYGPYSNKRECDEKRKDVAQSMRNVDEPGYWSQDSPQDEEEEWDDND